MFIRKVRKFVYKTLYHLGNALNLVQKSITVLCYHSIADDNLLFSVSRETFKDQIACLKNLGYTFVSADELEEYIDGKKELNSNSILLTFDDGYSDIDTVKDILVENSIKPVIFVLTDTKNIDKEALKNSKKLMTKEEMLATQKHGWVIGSHTGTHKDLTKIGAKDLTKEIVKSKKTLEGVLDTDVKYFAYPKGRYNKNVIETVKEAGYALAFSMDDGFIKAGINKFAIPRIGIDSTHSIEEFNYTLSPLVIIFRKLIKKIFGEQLDRILKI